jgi:CheY-like chemotaxis protein
MNIVLAEDLPFIYADSGQLQQILLNLVVNARDALHEKVRGERKITISTSLQYLDDAYVVLHPGSRPGWYVQIVVEDSGAGMSKEVMEHIFEPFYTTKGVGQGTGMGLATVYGIVKQNQGSIYVYSELGQGSTFKVYWPVMDEKSREQKQEKNDLPIGGSEVVLLVEDDKALREITGRQLRQAGYTVIEAVNGKAALETAASRRPGSIDLLFTDVVMPLMGGRELAAAIQDVHPGIAVLFASGYPDDSIRQDIVALGKDRFIDKPYNNQDLLRRIRSLLDSRQV